MSKTLQKAISEKDSNGAGKNEFVSQFTCLQPHLHTKIHVQRTHIGTRK